MKRKIILSLALSVLFQGCGSSVDRSNDGSDNKEILLPFISNKQEIDIPFLSSAQNSYAKELRALSTTLPLPSAEFRFDSDDWKSGVNGEVIDSQGSYNATALNNASPSSNGKINQAASFHGGNWNSAQIITASKDIVDTQKDFTISFWMYVDDLDTSKDKTGVWSKRINMYVNKNKSIQIDYGPNNFFTSPENVVKIKQWQLITISRDDRNLKIYVDGKMVLNGHLRYIQYIKDIEKMVLGKARASNTLPFNGKLDEFKFFQEALSDDQVQAIYQSEANGNNYDGTPRGTATSQDIAPVANYRLDETNLDANSVIKDETGKFDATTTKKIDSETTVVGNGIHLNGSNFVKLPTMDVDYSNGFTFSAWVKFDKKAGEGKNWETIFSFGTNDKGKAYKDKHKQEIWLNRYYNSNKLYFAFTNGDRDKPCGDIKTVDDVLIPGKLQHIAVTIDKDNYPHIFIDGKEAATTVAWHNRGGACKLPSVPRDLCYIGKPNDEWMGFDSDGRTNDHKDNNLLVGSVDEVKVFNKSLNESAIKSIYKNEKIGLNYDGTSRGGSVTPPPVVNPNPTTQITIDANANEWKDIRGNEVAGTTIKTYEDDEYVYFLAESKTIKNPKVIWFIDSDSNADTGYKASEWTSSGADYAIGMEGKLYRSKTNDSQWSWDADTLNNADEFKTSEGVVEVKVKKSLFNITGKYKVGARVYNKDYDKVSIPPLDSNGKSTPTPQKPKITNITVDGNGADWKDIPGNTKNGNTIKIYDDSKYAYFYIETSTLVNPKAVWFIDTDNNPSTGYQVPGFQTSGADYAIGSEGKLYKYQHLSKSGDALWTVLDKKTDELIRTKNSIELKVKKDSLNLGKFYRVGALEYDSDFHMVHLSAAPSKETPTPNPTPTPTPTPNPTATIVVDGDASDWASIKGSQFQGSTVKSYMDDEFAYFLIDTKSVKNPSAIWFIDADNNPSTGYQAPEWEVSGADYAIGTEGKLYIAKTNDSQWSWDADTLDSALAFSSKDGVIELKVAKSDFNLHEKYNVGVHLMNPESDKIALPVNGFMSVNKGGQVTGGDKSFDQIKQVLSSPGSVYISVGDSTRADSELYDNGHVFEAVKNALGDNVNSILQAVPGHTAKDWNNEASDPTWKTTLNSIPGDGDKTVVNISLGINDMRYYGNKEGLKADILEGIEKILEQKPKTHFMLTMPNLTINDHSTAYVDVYRELSQRFPMVDTESIFKSKDFSLYRAEDANDYGENVRIHLSRKGQVEVANAILSKIK